MADARAERPATAAGSREALIPIWAGLGRRQVAELAVPGAVIGLLGGLIAGGLAVVGGLSLGITVVAAVALALPLAIAGGGYDLLLAKGKIPLGPLTPAGIYWALAFPVARVIHAALVNLVAGDPVAVPHGWLDFVVYNMLLSVGFAIGFWWLHQNFAPRWWYHLRDRNPVADHIMRRQLQYLYLMQEHRDQKRQARRGAGGAEREPRGASKR